MESTRLANRFLISLIMGFYIVTIDSIILTPKSFVMASSAGAMLHSNRLSTDLIWVLSLNFGWLEFKQRKYKIMLIFITKSSARIVLDGFYALLWSITTFLRGSKYQGASVTRAVLAIDQYFPQKLSCQWELLLANNLSYHRFCSFQNRILG